MHIVSWIVSETVKNISGENRWKLDKVGNLGHSIVLILISWEMYHGYVRCQH